MNEKTVNDQPVGIELLLKECSSFEETLQIRMLLMQLYDKQLITPKCLLSAFHLKEGD